MIFLLEFVFVGIGEVRGGGEEVEGCEGALSSAIGCRPENALFSSSSSSSSLTCLGAFQIGYNYFFLFTFFKLEAAFI